MPAGTRPNAPGPSPDACVGSLERSRWSLEDPVGRDDTANALPEHRERRDLPSQQRGVPGILIARTGPVRGRRWEAFVTRGSLVTI